MFRENLKKSWYFFVLWFCRTLCRIFFRMRFFGLENVPAEGPFVLASNHQSFLDPVFCSIFLKKRELYFMARDTLFNIKIFGPLISSVNAIPVRRGQADISSIKTIIAKLKLGFGVSLFPEATRSTDGRIAELKGGLALLSRRGNAPVVPVLIDGAFECWPRHRRLFKLGSRIAVTYGQPIPVEQIKNMEDDDFAKLLTSTLRNMQSQTRTNDAKQPFNYS